MEHLICFIQDIYAFLRGLKEIGDELIVAVSTDEFNREKGKQSLMSFEERAEIISSIKYVDMVIPETSWEQKMDDIKKYNIDIFAMGDDWKGRFDYLKDYCEVIYLLRTKGISTTKLKKSLLKFSSITKEDLLNTFEVLEQLKMI